MDCENIFDEIKNQSGWDGLTTHDQKSCQLMIRIMTLVYNWRSLFVQLVNRDKHYEAITSRPLLFRRATEQRLNHVVEQARLVQGVLVYATPNPQLFAAESY